MNSTQQAEFEINLHNDPLLQDEFEMQKEVVNAIKHSRIQEIKGRLNQIQVGTVPQYISFMNVAASLIVVSALSIGSLFYFNIPDHYQTKTELNETTYIAQANELVVPEVPEPQVDRTMVEAEIQAEQTPVIMAAEAEVDDKNLKVNISIPTPTFEMPEIPSDLHDDDMPEAAGDLVNQAGFENMLDNEVPAFEIESIVKEELFHYQFYNGKLYLYGEFSDDLYDIIELKADNKRKVFLNHANHYYILNPNQREMTSLIPITDKTLIRELDILKD